MNNILKIYFFEKYISRTFNNHRSTDYSIGKCYKTVRTTSKESNNGKQSTTDKTKWRTHRSMNQVSSKSKPEKEVVNRLDKSTNAKKGWSCQQPVLKELASKE